MAAPQNRGEGLLVLIIQNSAANNRPDWVLRQLGKAFSDTSLPTSRCCSGTRWATFPDLDNQLVSAPSGRLWTTASCLDKRGMFRHSREGGKPVRPWIPAVAVTTSLGTYCGHISSKTGNPKRQRGTGPSLTFRVTGRFSRTNITIASGEATL